jgi:Ca2+/Na+ antiporter
MLENRTIISKEENKKINKKIVLNQTMILLIFGPVLLIAGILLMIIQITQLNNIINSK